MSIIEKIKYTLSNNFEKNNKISFNNQLQNNELLIFEPKLYEDVEEIAAKLLLNNSILININNIEYNEAMRLIDFLNGCVFAIKGELERISKYIFLFSPNKINRELINVAIEKINKLNNFLY